MTAHVGSLSLHVSDPEGIEARPIANHPGHAAVRFGSPVTAVTLIHLQLSDVRVIDRLIGALMDARRLLAPDDPASVVQVVPTGAEVAERAS